MCYRVTEGYPSIDKRTAPVGILCVGVAAVHKSVL